MPAPLPSFPVRLLFAVDSEETRASVQQHQGTFQKQEPVAETNESLEFSLEWSECGQLARCLDLLQGEPKPCSAVIISDRLTADDGRQGYQPSNLALSIRAQFLGSKHLCGLVGWDAEDLAKVMMNGCIVIDDENPPWRVFLTHWLPPQQLPQSWPRVIPV